MRLADLLENLPTWQSAITGDRLLALESAPLGAFSDRLIVSRPYNVNAVIAVRPRAPDQARTWLRLVTFARFRSQYSIIERMAQALAPAIVSTGVIPIIQPLRELDIRDVIFDAPWFRRLLAGGAVLYTSLS